MVEINVWNDRSNFFTSIYENYSRHPYCSPERTRYSYSKEYKEYARPFIPVKKEMMDELPCGLLLGHIKMLWIISFGHLNSNYRVASYFEYEYGIDFRSEIYVLETKGLIVINKDSKTNKLMYHLTDNGERVYSSNKGILEAYEIKKEFYNNSKIKVQQISEDKKYYNTYQKAFKYYFEDSAIAQELKSIYSTELISKIKIAVNKVFSKQHDGNSYRNLSIILSKSVGLDVDSSLDIVSSFSSSLNFFSKIESWKMNSVNQYCVISIRQLGINDLCIEDDRNIYIITDDEIVHCLPHCLKCKCHVIAYFSEQSISGTVMVNDPIISDSFEMEMIDNYKSWVNKLIKKHGIHALNFKQAMLKNDVYDYSDESFIKFYKENEGESLSLDSFNYHQLELIANTFHYNEDEKFIEIMQIASELAYPKKSALLKRIIGERLLELQQFDKAKQYFEEALDLDENVGVKRKLSKLYKLEEEK